MIRIENVSVQFNKRVHILHEANYAFEAQKVYALVGSTEQAQTAFLSIIGGLSNPHSGVFYYKGEEITKDNIANYSFNEAKLIRADGELIPYLSAKQNFDLVKGLIKNKPRHFKSEILKQTLEKKAKDLSQYEMIQVIVERSIINGYNVIILQEQFVELSEEEKEHMMETFKFLAQKYELLFILAISEKALAKKADKVVMISNGKLI